MKELLRTIPQTGTVQWMSIRPARRESVSAVDQIVIDAEKGIVGDHFSGKAGAKRQVTLIQAEHLDVIAKILEREAVDPELVRRNIVVSGINLKSLKNLSFRIGEATLFATGNCAPCSRMEENLGPGGYNAMRGHGGITARVVEGGTVKVGDSVSLLEEESSS